MQDMLRRYGPGLTLAMCLLVVFWLVMLVIIPNITLFEQSFRPYLPVVEIGGPRDTYSFANYLKVFDGDVERSLFGISFSIPVHVYTFGLTIFYSMLVTVICFLMAYPLAYYMAKIVNPRSLPTLILILFIPLWVSEVLRAFAWWIILAFKGPLNALLLGVGLIEDPIRWTNMGYMGVVVGLIYTYVLFMLFPLYNAVQSLDTNQIEAAEDLGCILVEDPLAHRAAAFQARYRQRIGDGVHAVGGVTAGAVDPWVNHLAVVHADHRSVVQGRARLEHRQCLRLHPASAVHSHRHRGDAAVQREAL
jgi:ABC-type spermidine/putrescine transport system permease subunit I